MKSVVGALSGDLDMEEQLVDGVVGVGGVGVGVGVVIEAGRDESVEAHDGEGDLLGVVEGAAEHGAASVESALDDGEGGRRLHFLPHVGGRGRGRGSEGERKRREERKESEEEYRRGRHLGGFQVVLLEGAEDDGIHGRGGGGGGGGERAAAEALPHGERAAPLPHGESAEAEAEEGGFWFWFRV